MQSTSIQVAQEFAERSTLGNNKSPFGAIRINQHPWLGLAVVAWLGRESRVTRRREGRWALALLQD